MKSSEKLDEIAPALVGAQRKLRNPKPDAKGQVRGKANYAYLSLPALIDAVREAFKDVGLAWGQEVIEANGGIGVTTRIVHLSGQWIDFGPLVLPASGGPQDYGSAITYGRRYSLAAAVGLAADEDDDASRAQRSPTAQSPPRAAGQDTGSATPSTDPVSPSDDDDEYKEGATSSAGEDKNQGTVPADTGASSNVGAHASASSRASVDAERRVDAPPASGEEGKATGEGVNPSSSGLLAEAVELYGSKPRVLSAARMLHDWRSVDEVDEADLRELIDKRKAIAT